MAHQTQMYSTVTWANLKNNTPGKKLVLEAIDYDFELRCYTTGLTEESKTKFEETCKVVLKKEALRDLGRGMLQGFLTKLKGNGFRKETDEMKKEVFFDGRQVISQGKDNINLIRVIGGYNVENNRRSRFTMLKVYKLNGWDEVSAIRETKSYDESKCIYTYKFPTFSVIEDCYSPEDRVEFEHLADLIDSIILSSNNIYDNHLKVVRESNAEKKESEVKTQSSTVITEEVSDSEFPF